MRSVLHALVPAALFAGRLFAGAAVPSPLRFEEHTLARDLKGGYQVVAADLNRDGRPDLIALASGMPELAWYENPGVPGKDWERHVLAGNLPRLINCAVYDVDGDGIPEIIVAWEFANDAAKSIGKVGVLTHDGDPVRLWKLRQIDEIPTAHRLRWADIDGSGRKVAINAVLTGSKASPPDYTQDHAPLLLYRPGEWKRETVSLENNGVMHGVHVVKWDPKDRRDSILTASFSGIDLYQWTSKGWTRTEISKGDTAACPKCGSSDVAAGHLGKRMFLAAIEAWHGNQVVIYRPKGKAWERLRIDDSLVDGHTILTADFDGDGRDEVVAGYRQGAKSLYLYRAGPGANPVWTRQVIDNGGMNAASCTALDLDADGRTDIACISGTTLKWYRNTTGK